MGYLLIDHSASLPSVQRAYGKKVEFQTTSCAHCQAVIRVVKRQGAWCIRCAAPVCETPQCATRCTPFFKQLEAWDARTRALASYGLT